jgi:amino acid transporter
MSSPRKKTLGLADLALFSFCAIFVLDTISASAKIGPSAIGWWLLTAVLYLLPYGLISAELGSAFPAQGGLAVWARKAFGERFAARTTWLYWVNVALWMPSVYVLFAGMLASLFFPALPLWAQVLVAIAMSWLTVLVNICSLQVAKWVPNLGALAKLVVVIAVLAAAVKTVLGGKGLANTLNFGSMLPSFHAGLAFLPVIVYNFSGFELMSSAAGEMKNPRRDVPLAVIVSGLCIAGLYILASAALLAVIPMKQLSIVSGITDMLRAVFSQSGFGTAVVDVIGVFALFTFFANMVTWSLGANRVAVEAAKAGELPRVFASEFGSQATPLGAGILTGLVSTAVLLAYACFAGSAADLFWSLFSFSSIIFLLPYVLLFPVFLKLRQKHGDVARPYRVPGPVWLQRLACGVAELFLLQSIVFFFWSPDKAVEWGTVGPLLIGVVATLLIGEVLIRCRKRRVDTAAPTLTVQE